MLSVCHQRRSQWLSFSRKFFTDIFVRVCFSNFLISGLRVFEEYISCYHFIHRQYCLLVTKGGHNDYLSVESFLLTSLWEFALATSWFLVYESLKSIVRVTTLFINSVVCWSTKIVTIFVLVSEGSLTSFSLFAFSIFLNSGSHSSEA